MILNESYILRLQELAGIVSEVQSLDRLRMQFVDSGKMTSEDFDTILSISEKKEYVNWLVKKVYDKIIPIDQLNIYKKYIELFDRRKSDFEKQDIFQYKTLEDVKKFEEESKKLIDIETKDPSQQKGLKKDDKFAEFNIGSVNGFDVYMLPKNRKDLYASSIELGSGTGWCTANGKDRRSFDSYISNGPLFIFIKPNTDIKYQISAERREFKNNKNSNVFESDKISFFIFIINKFPEYDLSILPDYFIAFLIKESMHDERIMKYLKKNGEIIKNFKINENTFDEKQLHFFWENYANIVNYTFSSEFLKKLPNKFVIDYYTDKIKKRDFDDMNFDTIPKELLFLIDAEEFRKIFRWHVLIKRNGIKNINQEDIEVIKFYIKTNKDKYKFFAELIDAEDKEYVNNMIKMLDKSIDSKMALQAMVSTDNDPIIEKTLMGISNKFEYDFNVLKKIDDDYLVNYLISNDFDSEKINKDIIGTIIKMKLNKHYDYFSLIKKIEQNYDLNDENKFINFLDFFKQQKNIKFLTSFIWGIYGLDDREKKINKLLYSFKNVLKNILYGDLYNILAAIIFLKEHTQIKIDEILNFIYSNVPKKTIKRTFESFGDSLVIQEPKLD